MGEPSEHLDGPFGRRHEIVGGDKHSGIRCFYGELESRFDQVTITCKDGEQVEATIVNCVDHFGFNYYVAVLPSQPRKVRAATPSGAGETLTIT
jgi:hypothetical protein